MDRNPAPQNSPNRLYNVYEHHADIKKNPLVPFKAKNAEAVRKFACNWHENPEILYVYDGSAVLRYGTENIRIEKGMTVIINSQFTHSLVSEDSVSFYFFIIDQSFFRENGIDITGFSFERTTTDSEIAALCMRAYEEFSMSGREKDFLSAARLRRTFLDLVLCMCEKHIRKQQDSGLRANPSEQYVKDAIVYINEHYTEKITLESIAKIIGINKSYFAREFKKYAGQTVHTYINSLRCTMADQQLAVGMNVTEAALACGFETLSYFSRTYKRLRGVSPATVRESSQQIGEKKRRSPNP